MTNNIFEKTFAMNTIKEAFLRNEFLPLMRTIQPDAQRRWGVMNPQQMLEHFSETVRMANGRLVLPVHTKDEELPKMRMFMLSERPFRENTKNPILGEEAEPVKLASLADALDELENEMSVFFETFAADPQLLTVNPIFGYLTYAENVHLLHKHAMHHLKQFSVID